MSSDYPTVRLWLPNGSVVPLDNSIDLECPPLNCNRPRNNYSEGDSIEKGVDWGTSLSVGCGGSPFIFTALLHNASYIILKLEFSQKN